MAADVVGYTRLMGRDEVATLSALKALRADVFDPAVALHNGRIVKLMGDGALIEFASVVDAVECAVAVQGAIEDRNPDIPSDRRIRLRIGVNLGDVFIEGDDIYGDGVNVASRLEGLADPGGLCVSAGVYEQVRTKLDLDFVDMGERRVKNVDAPFRVWCWPTVRSAANVEPAVSEPAPVDSEKPSLAVLPFDNISGDPEQEYFVDGMTEDLITDLSKISGLMVVARNSSSVYKGKAVDIPTVAKALGVRYVHEGSVRKAGDRVRINAQLIDARTGGHLWADRYDGSLSDVFELQDRVCAEIVTALSVQLTSHESDRLTAVPTDNLGAYELYVRACATPYPPIPERIELARTMFEQVVERDPGFAGGYAGLSWMLGFGALWSHGDCSDVTDRAMELAKKAIEIDHEFALAHTAHGLALLNRRDHASAIEAGRKATMLQPNHADSHVFLGLFLAMNGDFEEGASEAEMANKLNPLFVDGPYLNVIGHIRTMQEEYKLAAEAYRANLERNGPVGPPALTASAVAFTAVGDHDAAKKMLVMLKTRFPAFKTAGWNMLKLIRRADVRERFLRRMADVGVPIE